MIRRTVTAPLTAIVCLALLRPTLARGAPPAIVELIPVRAYPRQLVVVRSEPPDATVVWDPGLPSERALGSNAEGAPCCYIQVPEDAQAGQHAIVVRNADGSSAPASIQVRGPAVPFPAPRPSGVGIAGITSHADTADVALTVWGANIDLDATVFVDGVEAPFRSPWGGRPMIYWLDAKHDPATYRYPVYHYAQIRADVAGVPWGTTLSVQVRNRHGEQGPTLTYQLPAEEAKLDSDGDGLLDSWEEKGYPAPSGALIDLANDYGVDPHRRDILVEVDWMPLAKPKPIFDYVTAAFALAPVLNPDGSSGIHLVVDHGQGAPFVSGGPVQPRDYIDFKPTSAIEASHFISFFQIKSNKFDADRLRLFHYAIFAKAIPGGLSGRGEGWGNDFIVAPTIHDPLSQAGTFIHELGHNLDLTHGGIGAHESSKDASEAFKPNLWSLMSYRYQVLGAPFTCDQLPRKWLGLTFSQGMLRPISEASVDEHEGVCDHEPVDLDDSGELQSGPIDVNFNGQKDEVFEDADQWGSLRLDFTADGACWDEN